VSTEATEAVPRRDAVESLYRDQGARLWRAVYAYAGNRDIASEAVSEAFAQLLSRGTAVDYPDRWVWTAAFRIAAGELQTWRRIMPMEDRSYEMELPDVDLATALCALSDRERVVVVLHYYGGYRPLEIASLLRSSPVTVRVQLHQARRKLHELLGDPDG
jgi:RNA polymerase sigma-70 factor (ECF subfamily)